MPIGSKTAILAVTWCIGLILVGSFWAQAIYNRDLVK